MHHLDGSIVGTDGSVSLSFVSGYSSTSQWSVDGKCTQFYTAILFNHPIASQLSFSNAVEVSLGIPELTDVSCSDPISVSLTNTVGKMYGFIS